MSQSNQPIYCNDGVRPVKAGEWDEAHKCFIKKVSRAKHFMQAFAGYGIQTSVVDRLADMGCKVIIVDETDNERKSWVEFATWKDTGFIRNLGFGLQTFLPERYYNNEVNVSEPRANTTD